ncbi:MAG: 4-vinyl reductase [Oscillospiraceae bacterium]
MKHNEFLPMDENLNLPKYIEFREHGRENLGADVPVEVYRLLEYSFREELAGRFGKETQIEIFRSAGYRAGIFFAQHYLDLTLGHFDFIAQLQRRLEELRIGVLRVEETEEDTGKMVLTIAEDADCSGLPALGETVCNYDEGFLAGILTAYTQKPYTAVEVDCWATGDRVCRFRAEIQQTGKGK